MKLKYHYCLFCIIALLLAVLTACGSASGPELVIEDAWGRPSPNVAMAGAFYMRIKNTGGQADKLVGVTSTACGVVELHESYDLGEGVMGMRPVEGGNIEIPPKSEVELKMGGLHIMCIDKLVEFREGVILSLTMEFEKSGEKTVEVEIRQPDM